MSGRPAEIAPATVYGLIGDYLADAELFERGRDDVLHISAGVMTGILKRAEDREGTLVEIVDDVFPPLVRPRPGEVGT